MAKRKEQELEWVLKYSFREEFFLTLLSEHMQLISICEFSLGNIGKIFWVLFIFCLVIFCTNTKQTYFVSFLMKNKLSASQEVSSDILYHLARWFQNCFLCYEKMTKAMEKDSIVEAPPLKAPPPPLPSPLKMLQEYFQLL